MQQQHLLEMEKCLCFLRGGGVVGGWAASGGEMKVCGAVEGVGGGGGGRQWGGAGGGGSGRRQWVEALGGGIGWR